MKGYSFSMLVIVSTLLISCDQPIAEKAEVGNPELATATLEKIMRLQGKWQGKFEWTGAMTGSGIQYAEYYLSGRNSAVIENLINEDGAVSMTSVYHLDAEDLRMTHYCAAQNQPRLRANNYGNNYVEFDFVDITNLNPEGGGHVYGVKLEFINQDSLNIKFKYKNGAEESLEIVSLTRSPEQ